FAFDGEGGKRKVVPKPSVAERAPVASPAHPDVAHVPSSESANAATASAGGEQPQPPTKEEAAKQEAAGKAEAAKQEPAAATTDSAMTTATAHAPPAVAKPAVVKPGSTSVAPAPAGSTVREVRTPQGVMKFIDVRIDSRPAGATVMLVDNGR